MSTRIRPAPDAPSVDGDADWSDIAADTVLPAPVDRVLQAAFEVLGARPGANLGDVLTTAGTHTVLKGLAGYAALRAKVRAELSVGTPPPEPNPGPGGDEDPMAALAEALAGPDQQEAAQAAARVRNLLDDARAERKRARRQAKRAAGPTAEQKRQERDRELLNEARRERDHARIQLADAERRLEDALDRAKVAGDDLDELQGQLAATEEQLAALRRSLTDLPRAAERLLDALRPDDGTRQQQVVRPTSDTIIRESPTVTALHRAAEVALADVMPAETRAQITTWLPSLLEKVARPPRLESAVDLALTVEVLGGGDEVGGSCVLITAGGTRILVDCGTRPSGDDEASMAPPNIDRALEDRLDAVVVTHAHNDHIGWVPVVVARQPDVPVLATLATCDLAATMWTDAAKVLRNRTNGPGWRGKPLPPYSDGDVDTAVRQLRDVGFGRTVTVGALTIELFPAGHIVGAAGVVVIAGEQRVVVSGDVSRPGQKSVGGFDLPDSGRVTDLLLLESTYGDDRKPADPRGKIIADFVKEVQMTVERGGVALVPSFALGRAQEIALICAEHLADVEVLVDGLARNVSDIYEKHLGPDGRPLQIFRGNVRRVEPGKTIDEKLRLRSGVVIATSGMLNQGPAVEWARRVLPDRDSSLLLVGYQDAESPGKALLRIKERGGGRFGLARRDGGQDDVDVLAAVAQFHLGAHANADELVTMATGAAAGQLMLVHGEVAARRQLGSRMLKRGQRLVSPTEVWQPGR